MAVDHKNYVKKNIPKTDKESAFLREAISDHFLFAELKSTEREDIVRAMETENITAGTELIKQGDEGQYFYVISEGHFDVLVDGAKVFQYQPKGSFGELALLYNCPRAATVKATKDSIVWKVDRDTFRYTLASNSQQNRVKSREAIAKVELLKGLDSVQVAI